MRMKRVGTGGILCAKRTKISKLNWLGHGHMIARRTLSSHPVPNTHSQKLYLAWCSMLGARLSGVACFLPLPFPYALMRIRDRRTAGKVSLLSDINSKNLLKRALISCFSCSLKVCCSCCRYHHHRLNKCIKAHKCRRHRHWYVSNCKSAIII